MSIEPLLVFPDPPPPLLAQTLDLAGHPWKAVANASIATQAEPADGWAGAVVCADDDPEGAFGICRSLRKRDSSLEPVQLVTSSEGTSAGCAAGGLRHATASPIASITAAQDVVRLMAPITESPIR